jgi:hypothetical protein
MADSSGEAQHQHALVALPAAQRQPAQAIETVVIAAEDAGVDDGGPRRRPSPAPPGWSWHGTG